MSNYERIKAMSVEEMVDLLRSVSHCPRHPITYDICVEHDSCDDCWVSWLERECDT